MNKVEKLKSYHKAVDMNLDNIVNCKDENIHLIKMYTYLLESLYKKIDKLSATLNTAEIQEYIDFLQA